LQTSFLLRLNWLWFGRGVPGNGYLNNVIKFTSI